MEVEEAKGIVDKILQQIMIERLLDRVPRTKSMRKEKETKTTKQRRLKIWETYM